MRFAVGRVRISFLDLYPHVEARFRPPGYRSRLLLQRRQAPAARASGDPQQALCQLRTTHGITWRSAESRRWTAPAACPVKDLAAMGLSVTVDPGKSQQRKHCHCLAIKRELLDTRANAPIVAHTATGVRFPAPPGFGGAYSFVPPGLEGENL